MVVVVDDGDISFLTPKAFSFKSFKSISFWDSVVGCTFFALTGATVGGTVLLWTERTALV